MHTDQIYIARNGKSGMHVLVRILAVDDIGVDYPPIDPDNFNKLMMARDVKSLVLAARDLGPMYISADILSRRTFIPTLHGKRLSLSMLIGVSPRGNAPLRARGT